MQYLHE